MLAFFRKGNANPSIVFVLHIIIIIDIIIIIIISLRILTEGNSKHDRYSFSSAPFSAFSSVITPKKLKHYC